MSNYQHTIGGPAPYTTYGRIGPGKSVGRPAPGSATMPDDDAVTWSTPYPILPCNGLQWGHDGEAAHFSPVLPKGVDAGAAAIIYGVMTWVFYGATGPTTYSIERTMGRQEPWLNIFTANPADWRALDAVYQRLVKAADKMTEVQAICDELRP